MFEVISPPLAGVAAGDPAFAAVDLLIASGPIQGPR
jgi:hypothetical protein